MTPLAISPEVVTALQSGTPIVALESAVITHGLPLEDAMEALTRQKTACAEAGACPAVVAVFKGQLRVGLSLADCRELAARKDAVKVSTWNLSAALLRPGFGGTTVAASVVAAAQAGVRVLATGGIGGVHRRPSDVSADLTELSRHQVCVVCAGPKSFLDHRGTLERLETLGVPVIGWQSERLAAFYAHDSDLPVPARADSPGEAARMVRDHWALGGMGVVLSQPIPSDSAIPFEELDPGSEEDGVFGGAVTPAHLADLRRRLGARVVQANLELLEQNATLAAAIASELGRRGA